MVDYCNVERHYFAVDIAEHIRVVLNLFDADVVGCALHILEEVVVDGI